MHSPWRVERMEFGWQVVCDAPLGQTVAHAIKLGEIAATVFFETKQEALAYAAELNRGRARDPLA